MNSPRRVLILLTACGVSLLAATIDGCPPSGCPLEPGPVPPPPPPPPPRLVVQLDDPMVQGSFLDAFHTVSRWAQRDLTYSFHDFPSDVKGHFETAYRRACDMWSPVAPLTFHQIESGGDIQIWWIAPDDAGYDEDFMDGSMPKPISARADFPNGDQPIRQRINGDDASDWSMDFRVRIAAHELGHSLGLGHVDEENVGCGDAESPIMCGWIYSDQRDQPPKLRQADIDAIQAMYGAPDDPAAPAPAFPPITITIVPPPSLDENDPDRDGLDTFTEELLTWPTGQRCDPRNPDTDGDGLPDGYEVQKVLDPTNRDSDGDGVDDKTEIDRGTDPRSYVVVVDPGMAVVRSGAILCTLPTLDGNALALGLKKKDYLRAGFVAGDTITVTAVAVDGSTSEVREVQVAEWNAESSCAVWLTESLERALELPTGQSTQLLIDRPSSMLLTIVYPADGDFVPGKTDLIARVQGGAGELVYAQFFVLAPDPWMYYPQQWVGPITLGPEGITFAKAVTLFGSGDEHNGLTYTVWAELRSEPDRRLDEPLSGLPAECEPPCLKRSPAVTYTRGQRDTDGDCIADADEIRNGTAPYNANDPHETPEALPLDDLDSLGDEEVWWCTIPEVTPRVVTRADGLTWLRVDWSFEGSDSSWAYISRRLDPPVQIAYCQKVEADVQVFGSQRLKAELKTSDGQGGFDWVRTETFALEAGTRETIVIDTTERWGAELEHEGVFDLSEVSFTIDRRHDNPESGTYWIRNIRITGRRCLLDGSCGPD